jgi:hypothetical protein
MHMWRMRQVFWRPMKCRKAERVLLFEVKITEVLVE